MYGAAALPMTEPMSLFSSRMTMTCLMTLGGVSG
jgi:hypothetical protein